MVTTILDRLKKVRPTGRDAWMACCPAHNDRDPSLSVRQTDGRVLLHCFSGCSTEAVLGALGLDMGALFEDAMQGQRSYRRLPREKAEEPEVTVPAEACRFVAVVKDGFNGPRIVREVASMAAVDFYGHRAPVDCAATPWLFTEEMREYAAAHDGSLAGYDGPHRAEWLLFDLDNENIADAILDTIRLVERVCSEYHVLVDNVRVWYSGRRGFHLAVLDQSLAGMPGSTKTRERVRELCRDMARGIESFDPTLYDKNHLLRVPSSIHSGTGLYKIPLLVGELYTKGPIEITKRARTQRSLEDATKEWMTVWKHGTQRP